MTKGVSLCMTVVTQSPHLSLRAVICHSERNDESGNTETPNAEQRKVLLILEMLRFALHDQRGFALHDQRGFALHDQRGFALHDQRGFALHDM